MLSAALAQDTPCDQDGEDDSRGHYGGRHFEPFLVRRCSAFRTFAHCPPLPRAADHMMPEHGLARDNILN